MSRFIFITGDCPLSDITSSGPIAFDQTSGMLLYLNTHLNKQRLFEGVQPGFLPAGLSGSSELPVIFSDIRVATLRSRIGGYLAWEELPPAPSPICGICAASSQVTAFNKQELFWYESPYGWHGSTKAPFEISGITGSPGGGLIAFGGEGRRQLALFLGGFWRKPETLLFGIELITGTCETGGAVIYGNGGLYRWDTQRSPIELHRPDFSINAISGTIAGVVCIRDNGTIIACCNNLQIGQWEILLTFQNGPNKHKQNDFATFMLGPFVDEASERKYIEMRFASILDNQPDREAAIRAIATANDASIPAIRPIYNVHDPQSLVFRALDGHLAQFPLAATESIKSKTLCVLWQDEATPLMTVVTNMATLYLPLINTFVKDQVLQKCVPGADELAGLETALAIPAVVLTLAKELGSALLRLLGIKAWEYFSTEVLKISDVPGYYDKVLSSIKGILQNEFQNDRAIQMSSQAEAFTRYMELYRASKTEVNLNNAVVAATNLLSFADKAGIEGTFFYAEATIMLITALQETYARAPFADKAGIKDLIKDSASTYAVNIQRKHDDFVKNRLSWISTEPFYSWNPHPLQLQNLRTIGGVQEGFALIGRKGNDWLILSGRQRGAGIDTLRFDDDKNKFFLTVRFDLLAEIFGGPGTCWRLIEAERKAYRLGIENETKESIRDLLAVKKALTDLIHQPIPV